MNKALHRFFYARVCTPFLMLLLAILCIAGTALLCLYSPQPRHTNAQLYRAAVLDSMTIEDDELFPLVRLVPDSPMVTWQNGKVLLLTIHSRPERYTSSQTITLPGEVWTFTDKEMAAWYATHKADVTDWPMRLKQLIGVPPESVYSHVTAMWVSSHDVVRPAYTPDITSTTMPTALPKDVDNAHKAWLEGNIIWSYFTSAWPWTRLGYTYDWAENSGEYGLTEFLVRPGASVDVISTETIAEFIARLER